MAAFVNGGVMVGAPRVGGARVVGAMRARAAVRSQRSVLRMEGGYELSEGTMFDANPLVIGLAFIGWIVPSSLPSNIPLLEGKGLTPAFVAAIQENLAHWPKGPELADPFWLLLLLWHTGLFATLIFGSIGYNLRQK